MKFKKGQKLIVEDKGILINNEVVEFIGYHKSREYGTSVVVSHPTLKTAHENGYWYLAECDVSSYSKLEQVLK